MLFAFRPRSSGFFRPNIAIGLARWSEPQFVGMGQPAQSFTTERLHLRLDTPYRTHKLTGNLSYSHNAVFEQFLYGNDTAQYFYSYRSTLTWRFGRNSQMDLSYWLQKHRGYTPFRSDTLTNYENLDWRLQISPSPKFFLSATTGLDLERDFFRDLLLNLRWQPSQGMALDLSTGYSLERGKWRDIFGANFAEQTGRFGIARIWHLRELLRLAANALCRRATGTAARRLSLRTDIPLLPNSRSVDTGSSVP
jgi:hypothetical protein